MARIEGEIVIGRPLDVVFDQLAAAPAGILGQAAGIGVGRMALTR